MGFPSTFPATFPNGGAATTANAEAATITFEASGAAQVTVAVDAGSATLAFVAADATVGGAAATVANAGSATVTFTAANATTDPFSPGGVPIGNGFPYLGFPGSLQQLPSPFIGYQPEDVIKAASHELLNGGTVVDRIGTRRRFTLNWPATSDASYTLLRTLTLLPGPYRYMDPVELNLLTANQSSGTDTLRTTEGFNARFQGTLSSSTSQFRSWTRSLAWNTVTALGVTGRGIYCYSDPNTVDATWAAVRPTVQYTASGYLRASATVSMQAGIDWYGPGGLSNFISASLGTGTAISTGNFNTRVTVTGTAPAGAAYGVPIFLNTTTTGAAITVYLDEVQLEEGSSASAFRLGVGTPQVVVESIGHNIPVARIVFGSTLHAVEMVLVEC